MAVQTYVMQTHTRSPMTAFAAPKGCHSLNKAVRAHVYVTYL